MFRRFLGLILLALFALAPLTGCGGSGDKGKHKDADKPKAG